MATKSGAWRIWLGDLLIAAGLLVLLIGALFWTRNALAAGEVNTRRLLPSGVRLALPLPALVSTRGSGDGQSSLSFAPAPESPHSGMSPVPVAPPTEATPLPTARPVVPEQPSAGTGLLPAFTPTPEVTRTFTGAGTDPSDTPVPDASDLAGGTEIALSASATPAPVDKQVVPVQPAAPTSAYPALTAALPNPTAVLPLPTPTPAAPSPTPALAPYSAVIRLVIPAIKVDRAVVAVSLKPGKDGSLQYDTDPLFATRNRPDLVGQLVGSYSPGQGNNIVLIGHNYNNLDYGWTGVFIDIKTLKAGDLIGVFTEDGRQTNYAVQMVKQVPWRDQSLGELEKHMKYMGPSNGERLTLVTCGGANIWPFPARVYVVAVPVQ